MNKQEIVGTCKDKEIKNVIYGDYQMTIFFKEGGMLVITSETKIKVDHI